MKIRNYRRFMPTISRIVPLKCLRFGKLLILKNMEEISLCYAILLNTL
jgi:hypothetical protein